jgi:hypothetical protein
MKTETVIVSQTVELQYETEAGRKRLLELIISETFEDFQVCGQDGLYAMQSISGTATVKPKNP